MLSMALLFITAIVLGDLENNMGLWRANAVKIGQAQRGGEKEADPDAEMQELLATAVAEGAQ